MLKICVTHWAGTALFTVSFFALQYIPTWMQGNVGLKLQNSPKLPHIHARFHCNANEQSQLWKGLSFDVYWVVWLIGSCMLGAMHNHMLLVMSAIRLLGSCTWQQTFCRSLTDPTDLSFSLRRWNPSDSNRWPLSRLHNWRLLEAWEPCVRPAGRGRWYLSRG